jgi:hypothetical protein
VHTLLGIVAKSEWCDFWQSASFQSYAGDFLCDVSDSALDIATEGGTLPTNNLGVSCAWDHGHEDLYKQWMEF